MPLLNYTTEIDALKTMGEIEAALAKAGAEAVMKQFDADGLPSSLSFRMRTEFGLMSFMLPARVDAAVKVLNRQAASGKIPRRFMNNRSQATRVAWRIVREWTLSQLALIELEQANATELFLPFAQGPDGRTLAQRVGEIVKGGMLALR